VDKIISSDIALVGDAQWALNALWEAYQEQESLRDDPARKKTAAGYGAVVAANRAVAQCPRFKPQP
jgi:hypothetical protein